MRGNTVRARRLAEQGGGNRVGFALSAPAIARLANRGHVINVDAKFQHECSMIIFSWPLCAKNGAGWQFQSWVCCRSGTGVSPVSFQCEPSILNRTGETPVPLFISLALELVWRRFLENKESCETKHYSLFWTTY